MVHRAMGAPSSGSMTLREAAAKLDETIAYAESVAEVAPQGHAIFAAIDDARGARDWVAEQIPFWSTGDSPALPNVSAKVSAIVSAVYDAAASIQTDPEAGPPPTVYVASAPDVPWLALGLGLVGLIGAAFLFRKGWA